MTQPPAKRRAGILLHPTSLPGSPENGTLGKEALRFLDFLAEAGMRVWQVLPLGPTHADRSPYHCLSAHAGNPRLVSFPLLESWGWLPAGSTPPVMDGVARLKLLDTARGYFLANGGDVELAEFSAAQPWLEDYALYAVLREHHDHRPWWQWSPELRDRDPAALLRAQGEHARGTSLVRFEQFVFFRQWQALHQAARERGIELFGDLPIFVAHDSADVWAQREYFKLEADGQPRVVAGVPPDYFSATGQRWGNPIYDWARMQADGFRFWVERLRTQLELFDLVRIDHFRGFQACWEIPAAEETAVNGRWVEAPGELLFETLKQRFGSLPVIAEDLGYITPEVLALRERFGFPGMRVLQFGFDGDGDNPHRPHNHTRDSVSYTGTHDNDTTRSWFDGLAAMDRQAVLEYFGQPSEPMPWPLNRAALASVADLAILPLQDLLEHREGQRMNLPGTSRGNWGWRFDWADVPADLAARLKQMLRIYGR